MPGSCGVGCDVSDARLMSQVLWANQPMNACVPYIVFSRVLCM